ncbi:unnamed protein product, partial [Rotaria magnacalcarata]
GLHALHIFAELAIISRLLVTNEVGELPSNIQVIPLEESPLGY